MGKLGPTISYQEDSLLWRWWAILSDKGLINGGDEKKADKTTAKGTELYHKG
jgi:hypothetical protein